MGAILLGGTAFGVYGSSLESDKQPKAIVQDGVLASELTAEPIPFGDDGLEAPTEEPKGELACELTAEPIAFGDDGLEAPTADDVINNEADMYNAVLDYFIDLDEALNSDMKYIAVDFDTNIDDKNKDNVLENLKKYNVDIIEGNLDALKAKGLGDEYGNLDGILLSISDIKIESENKIIIQGSKYRSGLGSISTQVTINNDNGTWKIEASTLEVIS